MKDSKQIIIEELKEMIEFFENDENSDNHAIEQRATRIISEPWGSSIDREFIISFTQYTDEDLKLTVTLQ